MVQFYSGSVVTLFLSGTCPCVIFPSVYDFGNLVCDNDVIHDFPEDVLDLCPTFEFSKIKGIYLSYQNFNVLKANAFAKFLNLIRLTMRRCNIKKILSGAFKNQTKLRGVYLYDNNISEIEDGAFDDLVHVEEIDLDSNPVDRYLPKKHK